MYVCMYVCNITKITSRDFPARVQLLNDRSGSPTEMGHPKSSIFKQAPRKVIPVENQKETGDFFL